MSQTSYVSVCECRNSQHVIGQLKTAQKLAFGRAEIVSAQTHAESALAELAAVREREQALLQRRVETVERAFREGVADLEHRFLLQARLICTLTMVLCSFQNQHLVSHLAFLSCVDRDSMLWPGPVLHEPGKFLEKSPPLLFGGHCSHV